MSVTLPVDDSDRDVRWKKASLNAALINSFAGMAILNGIAQWHMLGAENSNTAKLCECTLSLILVLVLINALALRFRAMAADAEEATVINRSVYFQIGMTALVVKLMCDADFHYVMGGAYKHAGGLFAQSFKSDWLPMVAPVAAGLFALLKKSSQVTGAASFAGKVTIFFSSFDFVTGIYTVICGQWGSDAFQHAAIALRVSPHDLPWSPSHIAAAMSLYQKLGRNLFYGLFVVVPLLWLLKNGLGSLKNALRQQKRSALTQPAFMCCWLLCLGYLVACHAYDLGTVYYQVEGHGSPIDRGMFETDKRLYNCTQAAGSSTSELLACYATATTASKAQLDNADRTIWPHLNARGKKHFTQDEQAWEKRESKYFAGLGNRTPLTPDIQLMIAKERLQGLQDRLNYVCDRANNLGYLQSSRWFLPNND